MMSICGLYDTGQGAGMDKYEIINHAMVDGQSYTRLQLSQLVGFIVTRRTLDELIVRGCIGEQKGEYETTQADLFTITKASRAICLRDFAVTHQGGADFSVEPSAG